MEGSASGSDIKEPACNMGDLGVIPGLERSPEEGMATHASLLAWRIPMEREAWQGLQSMGSQRVGHDRATKHSGRKQDEPTAVTTSSIVTYTQNPFP